MAMLVTGTPGAPVNSTQPGTQSPSGIRLLNTNEMGISQVHGRYYEGAYRGGRFGAATQTAIAASLSTTNSTTYTGICLANPPGSGIVAALEKVGLAFIVAQTNAAMIGLGVGFSPTALSGVTALTARARKIGSGTTPVCTCASAATLPVAPTLDTVLMAVETGALTTQAGAGPTLFDIEGGFVLVPGAFVMVWSSAASTASSFLGSMQWEEIPA